MSIASRYPVLPCNTDLPQKSGRNQRQVMRPEYTLGVIFASYRWAILFFGEDNST
jgi:hypothetical protein